MLKRFPPGSPVRRTKRGADPLTLIFPGHGLGTTAAMGRSYLLEEVRYMVRTHPLSLPCYLLYNLAKIGGTIAAHVAERLPWRVVRAMSLHRYHWED